MRGVVTLALLLAGCASPRTPFPTPGPDTCNAAAYQQYVGQAPEAARAVPQPKRVYHITDGVTQDFVAERVNVVLDDTGAIGAITCG